MKRRIYKKKEIELTHFYSTYQDEGREEKYVITIYSNNHFFCETGLFKDEIKKDIKTKIKSLEHKITSYEKELAELENFQRIFENEDD